MATRRDPNNKPSPYRVPIVVGGAGVIILVLGFIIPGWGWLIWLGLVLALSAAFITRLWFVEDWIPTLFAKKTRDDDGSLPPPPTV